MDICVVDTSALIRDTDLFKKLFLCRIIIHTIVIEELSQLCSRRGSIGENARNVRDQLLKIKNRGDIYKGVKVGYNIIQFDDRKPDAETYLRFGFDPRNKDNLLICLAKELKDKTCEKVVLLTGDKMFSLKAGSDIEVKYIKTNKIKKRKPRNKGYYNKGQELAMKRV